MPRPARPWFRFYSEIINSQKAYELGISNPSLYFRWTWLLALANEGTPRGYLPQDMVKIAYGLRVSVKEATEIVNELKALKFIDFKQRRLYMHQWHDWNPDSDANLTPARAKRNSRTPKERVKNAERTPLERLDEEEDTDKDQEEDVDAETRVIGGTRRNVYKLFEASFRRPFGAMEGEQLRALEEEYPDDVIEYAFREAVAMNKVSLRYIQSVCESNKDGVKNDRPHATATGALQRADDPKGLSGEQLAVLGRLGILDPPKRISVGADVVEEPVDEYPRGVEVGVEAR